ncbi:hypothetical protein CJ030_MR0G007896 [Morella rubra]|uniref:Non-reducing end beta-L-arabinofuranosidase-like GH127 catalytic domain-containing protein n=1 Tax=Morella rubra TaxID=262757 RepID=A0A6A1UIY7_9ROSI|nr:hypothetical protein CJ030_MR0G007896 [Morella rubra]
MFSHYHLIPTDDSAWSNLLPRKVLREEDEYSWAVMYRQMKNQGTLKLSGDFLKEVSLHDVRLDMNSMHGRAQQTNLEYLLMLDVDSLVWSFRKTAGLPTPGEAYGGWEAPDCELRGHFVGHYLSASALMWSSTYNDTLKQKMSAVVSALSVCQHKMGTGYLSAFPSEQFDRFEAIKPVWAPYYTIHKILAGLLDQYTLSGNAEALKMTTWMVEYFYNRVQNVISKYSVERHYQSLNEETGGMNDVLYRLYSVTGDVKHLLLAHLFDKPCFLGILAVQADDISGFHANTHIPVVIGSQMRYEITGDPLYKEIGTFFMEIVNSSHSYATGGTSVSEFWSQPKRLASTLEMENEESCTTYNMLKVSRLLFTWTKEIAYADYYERALTNGVLSIQRGTEPGVMIYMLPQGRGVSKAKSYHGWGTKYASFWCCYGTEGRKFPSYWRMLSWKLAVSSMEAGQASNLNLRIPSWTHADGAKGSVNAERLPLPAPGHLVLHSCIFGETIEFISLSKVKEKRREKDNLDYWYGEAGNFLSVTRNWRAGDKLTLELPISLRTEAIKDDRAEYASVQAILYGPYLLAGHTSGDWDIKTESASSLSDWISPIPAAYSTSLVSLSQESGGSTFVITNSNQSITMEKLPGSGSDSADHATFRLILNGSSSEKVSRTRDAIGRSVMLEPFDFPGMVVVHQGTDKNLAVADSLSDDGSSVFHLVTGLDGRAETVSLESDSNEGCFVYSGLNYNSGTTMKLSCKSDSSDDDFNQAASFVLSKGISEYHPISFVAKGVRKNFLLAPLLSFQDQSYTIYFNIQD